MSFLQTFVKTKSSAFNRSVMTGSSLPLVLPILAPWTGRTTLLNLFMNVLPLFSACELIPLNCPTSRTQQTQHGAKASGRYVNKEPGCWKLWYHFGDRAIIYSLLPTDQRKIYADRFLSIFNLELIPNPQGVRVCRLMRMLTRQRNFRKFAKWFLIIPLPGLGYS